MATAGPRLDREVLSPQLSLDPADPSVYRPKPSPTPVSKTGTLAWLERTSGALRLFDSHRLHGRDCSHLTDAARRLASSLVHRAWGSEPRARASSIPPLSTNISPTRDVAMLARFERGGGRRALGVSASGLCRVVPRAARAAGRELDSAMTRGGRGSPWERVLRCPISDRSSPRLAESADLIVI